jgi:hypothetical protein
MPAQGAVSIASTATVIAASNEGRTHIKWVNTSAVTIWIGLDSTVTTASGDPFEPGEHFISERLTTNHDTYYTGAYYGIVTTGTADSRVIEQERIRR